MNRFALSLVILATITMGCAGGGSSSSGSGSSSSPNPARAAASAGAHYFLDDYYEVRDTPEVEFYFKKCSLENKGARAGVGRSFECNPH